MAQPAADDLRERLLAWSVKTIYEFPGGGIDGLAGAVEAVRERAHELVSGS